MADLATEDDVAVALGLANSTLLSAAQQLRVTGLLSRVSREFRREAERDFTPGTTTVRLLTVAGRVHLTETVETVDDVTTVTYTDCQGDTVDLEYELDGQDLVLEYSGRRLTSGIPVHVTYTHSAAVPADVVAAVAAIVARHLTVDPDTASVKELYAGPFRRVNADWASTTALLTEDECDIARSYRYPASNIIIQKP